MICVKPLHAFMHGWWRGVLRDKKEGIEKKGRKWIGLCSSHQGRQREKETEKEKEKEKERRAKESKIN